MLKINFFKILWIFPFSSFILGYYLFHIFLQRHQVFVPNIIGKSLQSSMNILSDKGLSLRLLKELEDPDLPPGTILDQIPKPRQKVKPNRHLLVTVSRKPKPILAPDFLGQDQKSIAKLSAKMGVQTKVFWLKSYYPIKTCIAQFPYAGQEVVNRKFVTYLSAGGQNLYVVPNFKGCKIEHLKESFEKENVELEIFHIQRVVDRHVCKKCIVVDQKPMSGSIIDLGKTLHIQVQVKGA